MSKSKIAALSDSKADMVTVEEKLRALYKLQLVDTTINRIQAIRGELPLEVQDLEDEIIGLNTRIEKLEQEAAVYTKTIVDRKESIKESHGLIKKYEAELNNIRNSREYDSLNKEIEFQQLEIQLSEKRIKEFSSSLDAKFDQIDSAKKLLTEREKDLELKQTELKEIISETQKDEEDLATKSIEAAAFIDARILTAYNRIRNSFKNGLGVVSVKRDACGGCYNRIPPQRVMDIRNRKKVIVCEYCGRVLVDNELAEELELSSHN